jgi:hypothetical protein
MIWEGSTGSNEPVILDPEWPYAGSGSLNADGSTAVLMVANSAEWEAGHGWQLFRRNNSEWRAAGSVAEVDWMNQPPILLSGDGNMAWTVIYQSTTENETVLLSHDFTTGSWEEWFGSEDMQIDLGTYYFAGIVPEG